MTRRSRFILIIVAGLLVAAGWAFAERPPLPTIPAEEFRQHLIQPPGPPEEILIESIGYRLRYIPPGEFLMGSPEGEDGRDDDEGLHRVKLTEGYYIGVTEVTQGQWRKVMGENPSSFDKCGDDCPVENVSWEMVQAFIGKLNELEGTKRFRLPTEAEWERACRAGSQTAFANGKITVTGCGKDANLDLMGWYCGNAGGKTHPVAQKQANAWGLFDLHGNVWEWVSDWKGDYRGDAVDPTGPPAGAGRVIRGGSWSYYAGYCRCANRYAYHPGYRDFLLGFRLAGSP